jgi:colanic acid biosynthesis protein WcaH
MAELGFEISLSQARLLGVHEHFYDDNYLGVEGINTHYVVLAYAHQAVAGQKILPDDQHSALNWWPVDVLLASPEVHLHTRAYFSPAGG